MPMKPAEILAALNALSTDEGKEFARLVAEAEKEDETPAGLKQLRSRYFAAGKSDVTKDGGPLDQAKRRVTELEAEVASAREEAANASKGQPTPSEREADLQRQLKAAQRDLEKITGERETARQEAQKVRDEADTNALASALKGKLRPRIADLVARDLKGRVVRKEDGTLELRDAEGIPVTLKKGQSVWDAAAQMAYDEAEPVDRLAGGDSGAGVSNGAGVGAGGLTDAQILERKKANPMYAGILSR